MPVDHPPTPRVRPAALGALRGPRAALAEAVLALVLLASAFAWSGIELLPAAAALLCVGWLGWRSCVHAAGTAAFALEPDTHDEHDARMARAKSAFLDNVSHEIRSPMAAILGYSDLLAAAPDDPQQRAVAIDAIQRTGRHLLGLINDLLDVSKLEAGRLTAERTTCPLAPVLEDVEAMLRGEAERKGLTLRLEIDANVPSLITTDPLRLRQILLNVAGNAVKFTDRGEVRVRVGADPVAHRLVLSVTDTGPGIEPAVAARLFQPFVQGDDSATRRHGGTGLGLSLSRSLARLLGGEVTVTSAPGSGSCFTISIDIGPPLDGPPLTLGPARAGPPRPTRPAPHAAAPSARSAEPAAAGPLAGTHILIADDCADLRRLFFAHLTRAGARVTTVADGHAALAHGVGPRDCDLVLLDLQMPGSDGLTTARRLRGAGYAGPLLAVTAWGESARADCRAAGFDGLLTKPIDRADLVAACLRALGRSPVAAG